MASGGADGLVRLWKFDPYAEVSRQNSVAQGLVGARGRVVKYPQGHAEEIRMVAFPPKGRLLASGGGDLVVRVWDTDAQKAALKALGAYEQGADLAISAGHVSHSRELLGM